MLSGKVWSAAIAIAFTVFTTSCGRGSTVSDSDGAATDSHEEHDSAISDEDRFDDDVRDAILAAAREHSIPLTAEQDAAMRSCAGSEITDVFATSDRESIDRLTEADRDLYFDCIEQEGLEEAVTVVIDVTELPEFVDSHNRESTKQVDCLIEKGWDIEELPADEDGLVYWEPGQSVFDDEGEVSDEFAVDADGCAQLE